MREIGQRLAAIAREVHRREHDLPDAGLDRVAEFSMFAAISGVSVGPVTPAANTSTAAFLI